MKEKISKIKWRLRVIWFWITGKFKRNSETEDPRQLDLPGF